MYFISRVTVISAFTETLEIKNNKDLFIVMFNLM